MLGEGWTCRCNQKTGLNLRWVPAKLGFTARVTTGLSLSFSWEWAYRILLPFLNWCLRESASKVPGKYLASVLRLGRVVYNSCWQLCCVNHHSVKMWPFQHKMVSHGKLHPETTFKRNVNKGAASNSEHFWHFFKAFGIGL